MPGGTLSVEEFDIYISMQAVLKIAKPEFIRQRDGLYPFKKLNFMNNAVIFALEY